jgi:hypothetical protein
VTLEVVGRKHLEELSLEMVVDSTRNEWPMNDEPCGSFAAILVVRNKTHKLLEVDDPKLDFEKARKAPIKCTRPDFASLRSDLHDFFTSSQARDLCRRRPRLSQFRKRRK